MHCCAMWIDGGVRQSLIRHAAADRRAWAQKRYAAL